MTDKSNTDKSSRKGQRQPLLTISKVQKARDGRFYMKVTGKGNVFITGHNKLWKKDGCSTYVYIPEYRVVGKPDDLVSSLKQYVDAEGKSLSDEEIKSLITNGYTSKDVETDRFKAEVEECNKREKATKQGEKRDKGSLSDLSYLVDNLSNAETAKKSKSVPTPKKEKVVISLAEKYSKLPTDKYLNVSNMKEDQTGVKVCKAVKPGGKLKSVDGVRVVSNNVETFTAAMRLLGEEYHKYIDLYPKKTTDLPTNLPSVVLVTSPDPASTLSSDTKASIDALILEETKNLKPRKRAPKSTKSSTSDAIQDVTKLPDLPKPEPPKLPDEVPKTDAPNPDVPKPEAPKAVKAKASKAKGSKSKATKETNTPTLDTPKLPDLPPLPVF